MRYETINYKGYSAEVQYSSEYSKFYAVHKSKQVLIIAEATSLEQLKKEFQISVDDHLHFDESTTKKYKGKFNVRVKPYIHEALSKCAKEEGITLNALVCKAVERYLTQKNTGLTSEEIEKL